MQAVGEAGAGLSGFLQEAARRPIRREIALTWGRVSDTPTGVAGTGMNRRDDALQAAPNRLFYGDNLDVLRRKIGAGSVDLCYIDPPFNSKRNYFQIYTNQGGEDRAQAQAFVDTWAWGDEAEAGLAWICDVERLNSGALTPQTVALVRGLDAVLGHGSLLAYLVHMTLRIVEIHRVLKPTGSFYLHCDPTASHYLKLVCDAVFCGQGGDFRNEIIWDYSFRLMDLKNFYNRKHDVILFYSKNKDNVFNMPKTEWTREDIQTSRKQKIHLDENGIE